MPAVGRAQRPILPEDTTPARDGPRQMVTQPDESELPLPLEATHPSPPREEASAPSLPVGSVETEPSDTNSVTRLVLRLDMQQLESEAGSAPLSPCLPMPDAPASLPPATADAEPLLSTTIWSQQRRLALESLSLTDSPIEPDQFSDAAGPDLKPSIEPVLPDIPPPNPLTIESLWDELMSADATDDTPLAHIPMRTWSHRMATRPITPDPDMDLFENSLEVDEAFCDGHDDGRQLSHLPDLSRLGYGTGSVGGVYRRAGLLRYKLSQDAAFGCPKVVKSRPRMRRRRKPGESGVGSTASSVVSSVAPSPAISAAVLAYP